MNKKIDKNTLYCSFCGKSQHEVKKLVAGTNVYICDECIEICLEIVRKEEIIPPAAKAGTIQKALDLACSVISGQNESTGRVATALFHHADNRKQGKSNLLLIGPSGTGKTTLVRTIAENLQLPLAVVDAANLLGGTTYRQQDPFAQLLKVAGQREKAERGVILVENMESLAAASAGAELQRRAQKSLLGMLDGFMADSVLDSQSMTVDTTGILFIASATFDTGATTTRLDRDGLVRKGLLPELLHRFTAIVPFHTPDSSNLRALLTRDGSGLLAKQSARFRDDGITVTFPPESVDAILTEAVKRKAGVRGLCAVLDSISLTIAYQFPGLSDVVVTPEVVARSLD